MTTTLPSFVCPICGESHEGFPTDYAYTLPDDVWAIPKDDRASQAKWTTDLCQFGERYFIRCLLPVAFAQRHGYYEWGLWVEVEWSIFDKYLKFYDLDGTQEPKVTGYLANQVPVHQSSFGLPVCIQFGSSTQRPTVSFPTGSSHEFAIECEKRISECRYYEILVATGALNPK